MHRRFHAAQLAADVDRVRDVIEVVNGRVCLIGRAVDALGLRLDSTQQGQCRGGKLSHQQVGGKQGAMCRPARTDGDAGCARRAQCFPEDYGNERGNNDIKGQVVECLLDRFLKADDGRLPSGSAPPLTKGRQGR